eukprot:11880063-Alexandrium_andersonii.AAC.1
MPGTEIAVIANPAHTEILKFKMAMMPENRKSREHMRKSREHMRKSRELPVRAGFRFSTHPMFFNMLISAISDF